MPTELLSIGYVIPMIQNQIYALPSSRVRMFSSDALPAFQQSNSPTFANSSAITLTEGMADLAGGFIRATGGNVSIKLTKF